ncbi:acyl carrier protein [Bowmanella sp. JS7-9]|uniref:Phosphopantetheine-binding protein n=1 Tax=Pseudobowmanella zhangzhouensis TaxID=1537679 RepID=A0ABW1XFA3_9ALTE|nr:acyl carrier protein [Bowmanella sp. JS7-9]TBX20848.1 hypothetical protein TK45_13810 [Bowmanella sp. JS7-9]
MSERTEVLSALEDIFDDVFMDADVSFSDSLSSDDIEEWDSLAQIRLLTTIEKHFSIQFEIEQIDQLKSVSSLVDAILAKMA